MAIRLKKSGSTLRFSAATIAATAGFWFGTAAYTNAQTPVESQVATTNATTLESIFNERDHRFSQLPTLNERVDAGRLGIDRLGGQRPLTIPQTANPTTAASPNVVKNASVDQAIVRKLLAADSPTNVSTGARAQAKVVVDSPLVAQQKLSYGQAATTNPNKPNGRVQPSFSPNSNTGFHQLRAISITQLESKLLEIWGDQLRATASRDGRFIRVALPTTSKKKLVMLVDRKSGKLQYEGAAELMQNWHDLIQQIDTPIVPVQPGEVTTALMYSSSNSLPVVKPVSFQQSGQTPNRPLPPQATDDPNPNQGQLVQGIEGLKGQVFISQNPETGALTITGDPDDVATVKREIARLSAQAQASQPQPELIPLKNVRGNLIVENIQEIYDARYAGINGQASITTVDNPNALVVVGSPAAIEAVRSLAITLDVEPDDSSAVDFKTFGLKYISAIDATNRLRRYFGQVTSAEDERRIPGSAVEIIPDYRSNQITVKGSPGVVAAAQTFLRSIDVAKVEGGAVNEVRVVQLKNSLASDVAFVIQNAINGQLPNAGQAFANQAAGGFGQQQQGGGLQNQVINDQDGVQSQLRSAMLSLMTRDETGKLIKSGILFDVRITADTNSNSLVITGPADSVPLVVELVKQLDRLPDAESQIKVFELVYSDAQTIFDMLNTLFGSNQNGAQGQFGGAGGGNLQNLPLQSGSATDGASLINLRFSIEPRSNAIIASGPVQDLQVIEDLLNRLDARAINNSPAQVYRLSNAPAQDVADAINNYLDGRADLIDSDPRTSNGVPAVNRAIIVTPEVVSNSLIVSALPEYRQEIENIIRSLDRRPPMIKVKVMIAEVDLSTLEEFGVELGLQDSLLFDRGTSVAANNALTGIGFPFNNGQVPNQNAFARELLAGQALSNLNVGRVNSSLGYGGLVLSAGNESVSVLMRALKDRQCVRVLSKPHIMTMENLEGSVSIGASVARIAGSTQTNFGLTQDVEFRDVGVILRVTPRVSPDGLIVLSVNAEKSSLGPEATGTAVGVGANGEIIRAQQILKTEAITTLSARSGQTVVFSGLITEEKTHTERGAPILSDIPVIGPLFKFESDAATRSELMIFMTPYLVTDDTDIATLNQDEMERMHWCMCDIADVYGNTDFGEMVDFENQIETVYPDADPTGMQGPVIHNSKNSKIQGSSLAQETDQPAQPNFETVEAPVVNEVKAEGVPQAQSAKKTRWNLFGKRRR
jgi:type II secretion system protein D